MYTQAMVAAILGFASADRIPLQHNSLSYEGLLSQKMMHEARANGTVEVPVKDYSNTQYFINVDVGTPAQTFTVVPDTGSSNLWIYGSGCKSIVCRIHDTYDQAASSTYVEDGEDFIIEYGSGGVNGYVSRDTVSFGGVNATMGFGQVSSVSGATFYVSQMDGIIGLGYDAISVDGLPTWLESTDLEDKSFGFYLHNNPELSYMTIPGMETDGLTKIATHDVIEQSYWNLNLVSIKGPNGLVDTTGIKAAIDSGTSLIVGAASIIDPLVEGIVVEKDCAGIEDLPDITFTIDATEYVLTALDYVV